MAKKKITEGEVEDVLQEVATEISEKPAETLEIAAPKSEIPEIHERLEALVKMGIPVASATFHAAVNNADGSPEHKLMANNDNVTRRAKMWWTPHTLICWQKGVYFGTPLANVISVKFL